MKYMLYVYVSYTGVGLGGMDSSSLAPSASNLASFHMRSFFSLAIIFLKACLMSFFFLASNLPYAVSPSLMGAFFRASRVALYEAITRPYL
jgi:hypothetical protein